MVDPPKWKFEHQTIVLLAMLVGAAAGVVVGFATSHETVVIFGLAYREDFRFRCICRGRCHGCWRGAKRLARFGLNPPRCGSFRIMPAALDKLNKSASIGKEDRPYCTSINARPVQLTREL